MFSCEFAKFLRTPFYRTPQDDCFRIFRATLLKWDTANSVWKTSDEYSLPRNTNLSSTVLVYHFFLQQDKLSVYDFIGLHYLLPEAAIRVEVFYKKGLLKDFVNFVGKHMCWSLFLMKFLIKAWHLFWRKSTNDCFCTALAPVSYLSVLIYIQHILLHHQSPMFIFGSSSKGFKECKSGISFSRKSHFHCCYFLFPCFFSFSVLCHFFLSAAPKKDSFKLRVD